MLERSRFWPLTSQVTQRFSVSGTSSMVRMCGPTGAKPGMFFAVQNREPEATSRCWISRALTSFISVKPEMYCIASAFLTRWARLPTT